MYLSQKALKEWKLVTTQDEMINWHRIYTPWLNLSLITSLDPIYQKTFQKAEETQSKLIQTLTNMEGVNEDTKRNTDQRTSKKKKQLKKKLLQKNITQKAEEDLLPRTLHQKELLLDSKNQQTEQEDPQLIVNQTKEEEQEMEVLTLSKEVQKKLKITNQMTLSNQTLKPLENQRKTIKCQDDENEKEFDEINERIKLLLQEENSRKFQELFFKAM